MAFVICRFWGQGPDWFYSLAKDMQIKLMADYRLCHAPPKPPKRQSITPQALQKRLSKFKNKGVDNGQATTI